MSPNYWQFKMLPFGLSAAQRNIHQDLGSSCSIYELTRDKKCIHIYVISSEANLRITRKALHHIQNLFISILA